MRMNKSTFWLVLAGMGLATACGGDEQGSSAGTATATPAVTAGSSDPRAQIFQVKGCPQCHSISALGVKSATEVGPDLTLAEEDVESRFGVKLEEFLRNPTGTMMVVLSSQIQLTDTEKDSIIRILKSLAEADERQGR